MEFGEVCDEGFGGGGGAAREVDVGGIVGGEAEDCFAAEAGGAAGYEEDFAG